MAEIYTAGVCGYWLGSMPSSVRGSTPNLSPHQIHHPLTVKAAPARGKFFFVQFLFWSCISAFGSRFGSNTFAAWLVDIHTQLHIVKILIHCNFPGKHPAAPLFAVVRYMKPLHVQRPSAVLADCSINNRIILPLFHTAFEVSIPQTTDNDKSRRGAQDLRRYKQRKRAFPICCDDFPHTEGSHLT